MQFFWLRQRQALGFTLVETLLALVSSVLLVGGMAHVLGTQAQDTEEHLRSMVQNARLGLEVMAREVRMAGYNPVGARFDGLTYTPTRLHLRADLNGDGDTDDPEEDIRYTYDAAQQCIIRTDGTRDETLAEQIQVFRVAGLDAEGRAATVLSHVRQLRITVTARHTAGEPSTLDASGPRPYTLTTLIHLRNPTSGTAHDPS